MKSSARRLLGPLLTTGAVLALPAAAAERSSSFHGDVEELLVIEEALTASTIGKSAVPLIETPFSINVIDSELIAARNVDSVGEALRYVPGVTTEERGGVVTRYDLYSVRGFDNGFGSSYFNGMKLYNGGWWLALQVDASVVERVEVLKGPASVLYGNTPPGGLVNVVSKRPQSQRLTEVTMSFGNHDSREAAVDLAGVLGDSNWSYRLVGVARQRDGQAITTEVERYVLAPSLRWDITDRTSLTLNGYYQDDPETGSYGGVPPFGSLLPNPLGRLDTDFYDGDENFESGDREQAAFGYSLEHSFNARWSLIQNLRAMDGELLYESIYGGKQDLTDYRTYGRASIFSHEEIDTLTVDNRLYGRFRTGPVQHRLLAGIDYQDFELAGVAGFGSAPPIDVFAPDNAMVDRAAVEASMFRLDIGGDERQLGYYLQDQIAVDRWVFLLGGRYDEYESDSRSFEQDNFGVRAGLLYHFDSGFAPYVSYTESFEGQGGTDAEGNAFEPTRGGQVEAGVKYESPDRTTFITLSAFELTQDNILSADPDNPLFSVQGGEKRSRGFELQAHTRLLGAIELRLSYSTFDVEHTDGDNTGDKVLGVAEETASAWAMYRVPAGPLSGLSIGGGVRYTGDSYATNDFDLYGNGTLLDVRVPSHTLYDLTVSYATRIRDTDVLFSLTGNNITDERYVSSCYITATADWCWYGAERTIEAGMRVSF